MNPFKTIEGAVKTMSILKDVQKFLSGKKTYLSAIGVAVPALVDIVLRFADGGFGAIGDIFRSPSYVELMGALGAMAARAAIAKAGSPAKEDPNYSNN